MIDIKLKSAKIRRSSKPAPQSQIPNVDIDRLLEVDAQLLDCQKKTQQDIVHRKEPLRQDPSPSWTPKSPKKRPPLPT
jgi:hypothetical protein